MPLVRAFIAIEIPDEIQQKLQKLVAPLKNRPGQTVRWVKSDNIHLTLKFFGETERTRMEKLAECLQSEMASIPPFSLEVSGFGAFPNLNRPRVFWCGLESSRQLTHLVKSVDSISVRSGYPRENRSFSPHLTLGRVNERAAPQAVLEIVDQFRLFPAIPLGRIEIRQLTIFSSQLAPGGSIYTPLFQIPLGLSDADRMD